MKKIILITFLLIQVDISYSSDFYDQVFKTQVGSFFEFGVDRLPPSFLSFQKGQKQIEEVFDKDSGCLVEFSIVSGMLHYFCDKNVDFERNIEFKRFWDVGTLDQHQRNELKNLSKSKKYDHSAVKSVSVTIMGKKFMGKNRKKKLKNPKKTGKVKAPNGGGRSKKKKSGKFVPVKLSIGYGYNEFSLPLGTREERHQFMAERLRRKGLLRDGKKFDPMDYFVYC